VTLRELRDALARLDDSALDTEACGVENGALAFWVASVEDTGDGRPCLTGTTDVGNA